jgi:hypothetical protein
MNITRISPISGKYITLEIPVTIEQMGNWHNGMLIQDAMPNVSAEHREFIMTGILPLEWDSAYLFETGEPMNTPYHATDEQIDALYEVLDFDIGVPLCVLDGTPKCWEQVGWFDVGEPLDFTSLSHNPGDCEYVEPIGVPLNLELEPLIDFDVGEPCVAAELQALAEQEVERLKGAGWNRADFAGALRKLLQDTPSRIFGK